MKIIVQNTQSGVSLISKKPWHMDNVILEEEGSTIILRVGTRKTEVDIDGLFDAVKLLKKRQKEA